MLTGVLSVGTIALNKHVGVVMKDYSSIENFNLAAIKAVRENVTERDFENSVVPVVNVSYRYKGRVLEATAKAVLWGYMDGEPLLERVDIISVKTITKFNYK